MNFSIILLFFFSGVLHEKIHKNEISKNINDEMAKSMIQIELFVSYLSVFSSHLYIQWLDRISSFSSLNS